MSITTGILTGGSNSHQTTSEEANQISTDFVSAGIVGSFTNTSGVAPATGSFAVNAQGTPDMTVAVSAGTAYVTATPSSQGSQKLRVKNSATSNVTISANASGSTKYDWIYISISAANAANPNSAADNVATLVASRSSSANTDDGTPPTYGYALAVVTVANGASSITNGNIQDVRTRTGSYPDNTAYDDGWRAVTDSWAYASSTTITVPSDATTKYDVGDLIRLVQTTTKYFRVTAVASTTLTVFGPSGDTVANAAISSIYYSKVSTPHDMPSAAANEWQQIGRTTLTSNGDTISVTPLPARKYLRILVYATATGGTINATLRFNNDSGANYSARSSANGGADGTGTSATSMGMSATASTATRLIQADILNVLAQEKLVTGHTIEQGTAGAGNTTNRAELANKWANTAAQITRIDIVNTGTGDFASGSELLVFGHD